MYRLLVIGVGNVLMSDDGLGIAVIQELKKVDKWYGAVKFIEVGTSIINYIYDISKSENLIAVDAIMGGQSPGTIYRIDSFDMICNLKIPTDSHGVSLPEALAISKELTGLPNKFILYGIEPYCLSEGIGISREVKKSLNELTILLQQEIDSVLLHAGK